MNFKERIKSLFIKDSTNYEYQIGKIEHVLNPIPNTEAIRIENFEGVLSYICKTIHRSLKLTTQSERQLTELYGKYNFTYRGEFLYKVWLLSYGTTTFEVYSSKRGMEFAVIFNQYDKRDRSKIIKSFLKTFEELLDHLEKYETA